MQRNDRHVMAAVLDGAHHGGIFRGKDNSKGGIAGNCGRIGQLSRCGILKQQIFCIPVMHFYNSILVIICVILALGLCRICRWKGYDLLLI